MACQQIASTYTNKVLHTVVNVYQHQFLDFKAPGLGDYIRGCFSMMQFLDLLRQYCNTDIQFEMDMRNHPLAKYIHVGEPDSSIPYGTLGNFHIDSLEVVRDENDVAYQHVLQQVVRYFNAVRTPVFRAFCCKYAAFAEVKESHRTYIRSKFVPTDEVKSLTDAFLSTIPADYVVLHIRLKDSDCFPEKELELQYLEDVKTAVLSETESGKNYVVISNHSQIRKHLNFPTREGMSCHLGQDTSPPDEAVLNTMLDFFVISRAKQCISFSPYMHGTGFGEECCKIYDVPFKLVKLADAEFERLSRPPNIGLAGM